MKKHIEGVWQRGNTLIPSRLIGGWRSRGADAIAAVEHDVVKALDTGAKTKTIHHANQFNLIAKSRAGIANAIRSIVSAGSTVDFSKKIILRGRSESDLAPTIGSRMLSDIHVNQIAASVNTIRQARSAIKMIHVNRGFADDCHRAVRSKWNSLYIASERGRNIPPSIYFGNVQSVVNIGNDAFLDFVERGRTISEQINFKKDRVAKIGDKITTIQAVPWLFLPADWDFRINKLDNNTPINLIGMGHINRIMPIAWNKVLIMGGVEVWKVAIVARMTQKDGEWAISDLVSSSEYSAMAIAYLACSTDLAVRQRAISLDMDRAVALAKRRIVAYASKGF